MYAARLINPLSTILFFPRCLRTARDFLILPDKLHRSSGAIIAMVIALLMAGFVAFAYAEKFHIVDNFFYGKLQFSFIDGGYPELFGYALELATCAIFTMFASVHLKQQWYAWAAILFVTFLDDAFKFHETAGHLSSAWLGVSPVEGDLIGFASTGLLSAVFWFIGAAKIQNEDDLTAYLVFTGYYALLIFFGVGVDAMHGLFGENMSQTLFTLVEDGGELLVTATIFLSAFGMWLREKKIASKQESNIAIQQEAPNTNITKTF